MVGMSYARLALQLHVPDSNPDRTIYDLSRIQYAFARVEDPNVNHRSRSSHYPQADSTCSFRPTWRGLSRSTGAEMVLLPSRRGYSVRIYNWLIAFRITLIDSPPADTYSPQISGFLKATHIVLQARNEDDVTPDHIYKRMQESSGSKYGAGNAPSASPAVANKPAPAFTSAPKPYVPSSSSASSFNKPTPGPSYNRPTGAFNKPTPSFNKPTASFNKPIPAPAAEEPPVPPSREPSPPPPAPVAAPAPTAATSKPAEDDRIAPVGTAYEPVKLAAPKKLVNRWGQGAFNNNDDEDKPDEKPKAGGFSAARSAFMGGAASNNAPSSVSSGPTPGKKLTWSERQAEAKKQREAEEQAATEGMSAATVFDGVMMTD
jgi:hypothetical protein